MEYPRIIKEPIEHHSPRPNLRDYRKMCEEFTWDKVSRDLDWFDSEHINISHVAIDSHLKTDRRDKKALIWESQRGEIEEYTFSDMARLSNKFANVLVKELGVQKGDRVFFFLERVPEIYIGILGTLKAGGVIGPLFSAFGPDAVKDRLEDSQGKVLVTSPALRRRIAEILPELPALENIIIVHRGKPKANPDDFAYEEAMASASEVFDTVKTN